MLARDDGQWIAARFASSGNLGIGRSPRRIGAAAAENSFP
jgi:hypothetical protein